MKKFSIRTVEELHAALKNVTTKEEIEAVFNDTTLKVLRFRVDTVSPEYAKWTRAEIIKTLVEWTLEKIEDRKLENLSDISYVINKRITERNIRRIKQCRTKQELIKLLSTGDKLTIAMIFNFLGVHKNSFKACINVIFKRRLNHG